MKKMIVPLVLFIIGFILAFMAIYTWTWTAEPNQTPGHIASCRMFVVIFGFASMLFTIGSIMDVGAGQPRQLRWYLSRGDIVQVKAVSRSKYYSIEYYDLLVDLKIDRVRFLSIETEDQTNELKTGYYYRYMDGQLEPLPIGKNS